MISTKTQTKWFLLAALAAVTVFAACEPGDPMRSTGSYPIDIFQEMHYNQSHKAQEPPRFMPPEGSIPVSGGFIPAPAKADAADLENPLDASANVIALGALVYAQNCSMCHGDLAGGDGFVGDRMASYASPQPPSLDSGRIQDLTSGEAYASISNGAGFMPAFQGLLTETERWALVTLIETEAGARRAALEQANALPTVFEHERGGTDRARRMLELRAALQ